MKIRAPGTIVRFQILHVFPGPDGTPENPPECLIRSLPFNDSSSHRRSGGPGVRPEGIKTAQDGSFPAVVRHHPATRPEFENSPQDDSTSLPIKFTHQTHGRDQRISAVRITTGNETRGMVSRRHCHGNSGCLAFGSSHSRNLMC